MLLQNIIIDKINQYYGKDVFLDNLQLLKLQCRDNENRIINDAIFYYTLFFRINIDYERDILQYKEIRKQFRDYLIKKLNQNNHNCNKDFLQFLIDMINYSNKYVKKVRVLAIH